MIRIYGSVDDHVIVESDLKTEQIDIALDSTVVVHIAPWLDIECYYNDHACWEYAIIQTQEGDFPWTINMEPERPYSLAVEVNCPEDTEWEWEICLSD